MLVTSVTSHTPGQKKKKKRMNWNLCVFVSVLWLSRFQSSLTTNVVHSTAEYGLWNSRVTCGDDNTDCNIVCAGTYSCWAAHLVCPTNANCNIFCNATQSCYRYAELSL